MNKAKRGEYRRSTEEGRILNATLKRGPNRVGEKAK